MGATTPAAPEPAPGLSERARDRLACGGPAAVAFVVYLLTACRTVYVGDSGELATVCATFGIPHPSGYPLYAIGGGLFVRLLPLGSLAFRANVFSGACAAAAVATCAALVLDLLRGPDGARPRGGRAAAAGAGALLAFSAAFWQEATVARVYALNAWLSLATIRAGLAWARDGDLRGATRTGVWGGLACANHLAALGAVAGALAAVAVRRWRSLVADGARGLRAAMGRLALGSVPGVLCYLYLPLRFAERPVVRWDPPIDSLGGFLDYVLRTTYAGRSWTRGDPLRIAETLGHGAATVATHLTILGAGLAVAGFLVLRRRREVLAACGAWALVFGVLFALHGQRRDLFLWDRYWIPFHAIAAVGAGAALAAAGARLRWPAAAWALALALPLALVPWHWARCDRSGETRARDYALQVLTRLPERAILFADDDNVLAPLLYLQVVEGKRRDVRIAPAGMRREPIEANLARDQFFQTSPMPAMGASMRIVPEGLVFRAIRAEAPDPPPVAFAPWRLAGFEAAPPPAAVPESHVRELLSRYFRHQGFACAATEPAVAEAALARAEAYGAGNERDLEALWKVYTALARPADAERLASAIRRLDPAWTEPQ